MPATRPAPRTTGKSIREQARSYKNQGGSNNKNAGSPRREPALFIRVGDQPRFLPSSAWYSSLSPSTPTTRLCSCSTSLWPVW